MCVEGITLILAFYKVRFSQTQKGPYGTLLVHIDGEQEPLEQAITYMMESANGEVVQDA